MDSRLKCLSGVGVKLERSAWNGQYAGTATAALTILVSGSRIRGDVDCSGKPDTEGPRADKSSHLVSNAALPTATNQQLDCTLIGVKM